MVRDLRGVTPAHVRQSNLIEEVDDPAEDDRSLHAWEWLANRPVLTVDVVLECHRRIMAALMQDAGRLRRCHVRVGRRICPPPEQVPTLLDEWLDTMADPTALGPVEAHVRFEHIHPFRDGNGRTGRMLLWWHQVAIGEEPILIHAVERHLYYQWFHAPEDGLADMLTVARHLWGHGG